MYAELTNDSDDLTTAAQHYNLSYTGNVLHLLPNHLLQFF
jgi:hypothetical protein